MVEKKLVFNAPHPFEGTTVQVETVLQEMREWIRKVGTTIAEISPDHIHEEIDFGKRQGREEW